ncbi:transporter [Malaciobacter halophilus]|uniref:Transporter n=1 Tax=Malaciobacter halophilus TaxID=197482 RepID=A0A2N1J5Y0_9BACT|nr:TolC family protein [Malaciobacter halophilus]AXH09569.1 RND family efflux system, outer membrane channel protein, TolC family [Malaciobacter halophilus]PKI81971.1 transporter [Malaciobacter halophilus]
MLSFQQDKKSLDELINLSIQNRLVDSYKSDLESLKKEYSSVKSSYLPSININANYSKANKEIASTPDNSTSVNASVDYTLYDGGKKYDRYASYEMNIKGKKEDLVSIKNQLALDVTKYYYDYLSLLAKKDAKKKEIEQLKAQYERLSRFLEAGTTTEDEIQKIISRGQSANVNLHEIELQLQTIIHNLEYITGQSVTISDGSFVEPLKEQIEQSNRADIESLKYQVKALFEDTSAQKSDYLPTISLNNTYTHTDMNYDNNSFKAPYDEQNIFSVNLKWNIFSFGETKNRYESRYKKYISAKSKYEYERNRANTDLKLAKKAYEIAKLKIKSAQAGLKAANSAYEVIKSKYQSGLIDNVAFLESLSEKYDAISVLKSALYDIEVKKANIIYHSGKNIKEYIR